MGVERELTKVLITTAPHTIQTAQTTQNQTNTSPAIVAVTITMNAVSNATARATTKSITVNSGYAKVAANASVGQREAMT